MSIAEFTVHRSWQSDRRSPLRWLWSHVRRNPIWIWRVDRRVWQCRAGRRAAARLGGRSTPCRPTRTTRRRCWWPPYYRRQPDHPRAAPARPQLLQRDHRPAPGAGRARRNLRQPDGQEHVLPRLAPHGRPDGARHQRRARDQLDVQPGAEPGDRLGQLSDRPHRRRAAHRPSPADRADGLPAAVRDRAPGTTCASSTPPRARCARSSAR